MALPSSESTYGSPPYHETAFKAALRLLASNIGPALSGLSAVRPGSNFGEAFLSSLGGSSRAVSAAHQAAQAYAMKQQEMDLRQQEAAQKAAYMKALTDNAAKPPKPEKPTKDAEAERILGRPLTDQERQILAGVYKAPPKGAKAPKYKPPGPPPRTGDAYDRATGQKFNAQDEADILGIQKAGSADIPDLVGAYQNPRTPPRVKAAAKQRLKELGVN